MKLRDPVRKKSRRTLIYYLNIKDSKKEIGKLADISLNGILMFSEDKLESEYRGRIIIESSSSPKLAEDLVLTVENRWTRKDKSTGLYYHGMEIIDNSPELEKKISHLIDNIGFSDGMKKVRQGLFFPDFF
jgi:c-di-GMP-binding flagellar brake protein YcgR